MYDLLITGAVIVNADGIKKGSIAVKAGKVAGTLKEHETAEAVETLNIEGKYIFPGFIDCHVHFNEPGYTWRENFETGSQAAALGGVTTVVDMPMLNKPAVMDAEAFAGKLALIEGRSAVDFGFWGALINSNMKMKKLEELNKCGVLAFKCFMCDPGEDYTSLNDEEIHSALSILKKFGGLAGFHCEDDEIVRRLTLNKLENGQLSRMDYLESRPVEAELKATKDLIRLAESTGAKVHICHVSHPAVAEEIRLAKRRGIKITSETCLHYLVFNEETLLEKGMLYKCSPPLRKKADSEALWSYVCDGTIDLICSDHSPATEKEKEEGELGAFGAWGGISGVQTTVQGLYHLVVNSRGESPCMVARLMSQRPAEIFSVYGRKGRIQEGFDADFTVIDPQVEWEITAEDLKYKNRISAFTGLKGKGKPVLTVVRGKIVSRQGELTGSSHGRLVTRI
ncbi:allantoinase [Ruminiclostridium hungatei]|uniref:allantoinase n=1 Tax=Ruminiclostridium hungatei TaxID=48256 RepID=A0A1V4SJE8_RUMHU|nr:allantoinase AllB [Ruminiclostridium hungatei]OPX43626.1 allantoinase [Ruminiclostridium hungatei]